ncbi:MAG TPA: YetF domain-containing protein, partial [Balneolaceae bacterium]|nr:YetF domain-containing protein [Balneolaceae bacterium]
MEMILNAIFIYVFILLLFRIAGKRTLSRLNSRDLILLVIISEATQQGMLMNDLSITGAFTVIATLVAMDMCTSWISKRWKLFDIIVNGTPTMIIKDGILMEKSLKKAQITIDDI